MTAKSTFIIDPATPSVVAGDIKFKGLGKSGKTQGQYKSRGF